MPVGLNAAGVVGVAFESVIGTYVAPTKFIPVRSETLETNQELIQRRVIRNLAGLVGVVKGNMHVAGDLEIEVLDDTIIYFLAAMRTSAVKGGTMPDFTYTFTPGHSALPPKSLSITVVRNGEVFGFVGCIVGSCEFSLDNGMLIARLSIIGANEASQSLPSPSWPTTVPFGPGQYNVEIPSGNPVCDVDMSLSLSIDDSATPEFRLCGDHGAEFSRFGERSITLSLARDFEDRTDFDAFKAATSQSITIEADHSATRYFHITLPVAYKNSYSVGLASQGDLTRASIEYIIASGAGDEYTIEVGTAEDVTI